MPRSEILLLTNCLRVCLSWSFVLTRCFMFCSSLCNENTNARHIKCSRGTQVSHPCVKDRGVTRLIGARGSSNLRSFGSKCAVLKKALVTLLELFGAPRSHSTPPS